MDVRDGFLDAIGNTPLIRLKRASEETGCEILGKAEFLNPGSSVKDRAALAIVRDAEARGMLRPGGVIVEGTAGNTGIGLALVGNARGYRTVIVIPETQSREKIDMLRLCGAEVRTGARRALPRSQQLREGLRPARRGAGEAASRTARSGPTSSTTSPTAAATTRPPARRSGDRPTARVDGFVCAVGTGGTLAGVGMFLKEQQAGRRHRPRRSDGRGALQLVHHRRAEDGGQIDHRGHRPEPHHRQPGGRAGRSRLQIRDAEALPIVFDLLKHEGLCLGGSSGINVAGAIRLARELGPGHVIVTILCDYGTRYQSKLFNPAFLAAKGLPVPDWLE